MGDAYSGKERRVSQDEQLGFIRGKVEAIQDNLTAFKAEVKEDIDAHTDREEKRMDKLESIVATNAEDLATIAKNMDIQANTHRYIWLTIKSLAAAFFLALTFKFGDILTFIKAMMK